MELADVTTNNDRKGGSFSFVLIALKEDILFRLVNQAFNRCGALIEAGRFCFWGR